MNRAEIFQYVNDYFGTQPEYLWTKFPRFAVLRNSKWYAVIMEIPKSKLGLDSEELVDVINVKCGPALVGNLRKEKGIYPAYHMNKDNWISILLDGTVSDEMIQNLLALSYELTASKAKNGSLK